jgi:hypothetical protein
MNDQEKLIRELRRNTEVTALSIELREAPRCAGLFCRALATTRLSRHDTAYRRMCCDTCIPRAFAVEKAYGMPDPEQEELWSARMVRRLHALLKDEG